MHLVEGELIEEIEKLDEGWWSGVGENGAKHGLFPGGSVKEVLDDRFLTVPPPANYVEETAQADEQEPEYEPEPEPEPEAAPPPPPPPPPPAARKPSPEPQDQGVTAIALYEYVSSTCQCISIKQTYGAQL